MLRKQNQTDNSNGIGHFWKDRIATTVQGFSSNHRNQAPIQNQTRVKQSKSSDRQWGHRVKFEPNKVYSQVSYCRSQTASYDNTGPWAPATISTVSAVASAVATVPTISTIALSPDADRKPTSVGTKKRIDAAEQKLCHACFFKPCESQRHGNFL